MQSFLKRPIQKSLPKANKQKGQALVEYILILILVIVFARYVFFHERFGIQATFNNTMLRLGTLLEQNLKSGAQPGNQGEEPFERYSGSSDNWKN